MPVASITAERGAARKPWAFINSALRRMMSLRVRSPLVGMGLGSDQKDTVRSLFDHMPRLGSMQVRSPGATLAITHNSPPFGLRYRSPSSRQTNIRLG